MKKKPQKYFSITESGKRTQIFKPQLKKNIIKQRNLIKKLESQRVFTVGPTSIVLNMEREKLMLLESQVKLLRRNMSKKNLPIIKSIHALNKQIKKAKPNINIATRSLTMPFSEYDWGMIIGYKIKNGHSLTAYENALMAWHNDKQYYKERNSGEFWTAYNYYFDNPQYLPRLARYIEATI